MWIYENVNNLCRNLMQKVKQNYNESEVDKEILDLWMYHSPTMISSINLPELSLFSVMMRLLPLL